VFGNRGKIDFHWWDPPILTIAPQVWRSSILLLLVVISLDDVTKNSIFVVACLRNHEKYSHCWIDFVCDDIACSLME
jgi:hypothetical protein